MVAVSGWWFFWTFVFGLVPLYFVFYSTRALGWVVTRFANWFFLPRDTFFAVRSVNLALIGNRIGERGGGVRAFYPCVRIRACVRACAFVCVRMSEV